MFDIVVGRDAGSDEMAYWREQLAEGASLDTMHGKLGLLQQAGVGFVDSSSPILLPSGGELYIPAADPALDMHAGYAPAGSTLTLVGADGTTLAVNSARNLLAVLPVYVALSSGVSPSVRLADGRTVRFGTSLHPNQNSSAVDLANYLRRTAASTASYDPLLDIAYNAAQSYFVQTAQPEVQAAVFYKLLADYDADANPGHVLLDQTASSLALKIAETPEADRKARGDRDRADVP